MDYTAQLQSLIDLATFQTHIIHFLCGLIVALIFAVTWSK